MLIIINNQYVDKHKKIKCSILINNELTNLDVAQWVVLFLEQARGKVMCTLVWIPGLVYSEPEFSHKITTTAQPNSTTQQTERVERQPVDASLGFWHAADPVCTPSFTAALVGRTQSPRHLCKLSFTWTREREGVREGGAGGKGRGQLVIFHHKDSTKLTSLSFGQAAAAAAVAAAVAAAAAPNVQRVGAL